MSDNLYMLKIGKKMECAEKPKFRYGKDGEENFVSNNCDILGLQISRIRKILNRKPNF